jgi:hypothetical protein
MASNVSTGARVLVTGATGFVGAHVVDQFLKSGYVVIGTSRNAKKASNVEKYFKDKYGPDRFEIYEAGDIVKEGAFDEVVKGRLKHGCLMNYKLIFWLTICISWVFCRCRSCRTCSHSYFLAGG